MMGIVRRPEPKLFYSNFNLNERIPPEHVLRRVDQLIDFSFAREQVAHLYGRCGNESVDPAVVLKLLFLLFHEDVASERSLMEQMPCRLDWLWFCGYDLESVVPNHSIISKARRRWGPEVFKSFFANVLEQCLRAGLVDGQRVHVDSSLVEASADRGRLQPALRLSGQELYEKLEQTAEPPPEPTAPAEPTASAQVGAIEADAPAPAPAQQPQPTPEPLPAAAISPADPDARLTRKYGQVVLGYKDHRVVDDRCGVITATVTTDAATADGAELAALLDQHQFNVHARVREVAADKAYGTADNYRDLQQRDIRPCVPHERYPDRPGKFPRSAFRYDAERDGFICPAGQFLGRWNREEALQRTRYRAARGVCANCRLKAQCSDAKEARLLSRYDGQQYIEWADACGSGPWRRHMMRRRKIRAEGSFADAANNHGFKRARWRGLWRVTIQNYLVATVQNTRKLLRATRSRKNRGQATVLLAIFAGLRALQTCPRRSQAALEAVEVEL